MAETKAEQDQVVAAAKEAIELEKQKALADVRAQVISLSMMAASKIVEQKLGSEEDKKMMLKKACQVLFVRFLNFFAAYYAIANGLIEVTDDDLKMFSK